MAGVLAAATAAAGEPPAPAGNVACSQAICSGENGAGRPLLLPLLLMLKSRIGKNTVDKKRGVEARPVELLTRAKCWTVLGAK